MSTEVVEAVAENPLGFLGVVVFCYGGVLATKYANVHADILRPLEEVAGKGKVTLIRAQVKEVVKAIRRGAMGNKADKFLPPIALVARCSDEEARVRLTTQATFGATCTIGFHVLTFDTTRLSWCLGFHRTDIVDPPKVTERRLCYAVYEGVRKSPKLFSIFDRAMQGGSKFSRDQRLLNWCGTLDARFLPHEDSPVYVLFAKPCTDDPLLWDEIRAAMRTTYTDDLEAFILHANAAHGHNLCADCKYDDHPRYNCIFTACNKSWWGPLGLEAILKDLRGGGDDDDDEGTRRGIGQDAGEDAAPQRRGPTTVDQGPPASIPGVHAPRVGCPQSEVASQSYPKNPQLQTTTTGTMFHTHGSAMGNSGTGGGGSSATGTRPIDEGDRSGGEMADARLDSGRANATPGAARSQGGTSTGASAHHTHGPIQRHQTRPVTPHLGADSTMLQGDSNPRKILSLHRVAAPGGHQRRQARPHCCEHLYCQRTMTTHLLEMETLGLIGHRLHPPVTMTTDSPSQVETQAQTDHPRRSIWVADSLAHLARPPVAGERGQKPQYKLRH
ncbi:hypothetical protein C8R44DRAFT_885552 [Mycena epipterygia]|nr:hypothetical protein C8R44DRAFT_885552 [Mycena epipterygia]